MNEMVLLYQKVKSPLYFFSIFIISYIHHSCELQCLYIWIKYNNLCLIKIFNMLVNNISQYKEIRVCLRILKQELKTQAILK